MVGVVLLGLVGGLLLVFAPMVSHRAGLAVAQPFWAVRTSLANRFSYIGTFFTSHKSLVAENDALRLELDRTKADLLAYDTLASEHHKLLDLYGREEGKNRVLGVVLVKPPQSPYDVVVIDIGTDHAVQTNDDVYGFGNVALGTVSAVTEHTATVTLFSNATRQTPATVERSDVSLLLVGTGGAGFEAKIPQDVDVLVGDTVVLPALHTSILGRVIAVESSDASSFKRVVVQSPVNIHNLRWLEVSTQ